MRKAGRNVITLVMVLLLVLIAACAPTPEKVTPSPTPEPEPIPIAELGIIEIRVTDPPPPGVTSAVVHLTKIEAHRVVGAGYKWEPIFEGSVSFDLIEIFDKLKVLGWAEIEAGSFTQIRMDVTEVVVTIGGYSDPISATVPSDKLRIVRPFNVEGGVKTILTLDFDGDKSLILPGKDVVTGKERALFKPVVKLLIEKEKVED